ncbi:MULTISPECIES: hypothetical protein [unclassified Uliginosibacterium]|jgi:hypothetical protein|uniref:hypothetical protein n=1 Tax=unclassified Uliginosibacterium TaxID=2621521 RepID=UPI000C7DB03B|nr:MULTISPECIES: hypothetical protein [unclassified Uliginosibacterium]MDO6385490.1 hypothetical protein [Uliginosibacterium sp. 31-12]PLK47534.1 hypothetical protein C0V76_16230 [Uliginosibacterium sp. TH139]
MKRLLPTLLLPAWLVMAACSTLSKPIPSDGLGYAVTYGDVLKVGVLIGTLYYITDPRAPSWEISETRLPDQRVIYQMNKQYLSVGGDGEAGYIMRRRAESLVRELGMADYRIERFEEAVDNRILLPRRTAYAEIRMIPVKAVGG